MFVNVDILKYLGKAIRLLQKRGEVNDKIINDVNNLTTAIQQACLHTSMRFNQALLLEKTLEGKKKILFSLGEHEIEAYARLNEMCAPIQVSSQNLHNFFSNEGLNTPLDKQSELLKLFTALFAGEQGMQAFIMEYIQISKVENMEKSDLDNYLRENLKRVEKLTKSAWECQSSISALL